MTTETTTTVRCTFCQHTQAMHEPADFGCTVRGCGCDWFRDPSVPASPPVSGRDGGTVTVSAKDYGEATINAIALAWNAIESLSPRDRSLVVHYLAATINDAGWVTITPHHVERAR